MKTLLPLLFLVVIAGQAPAQTIGAFTVVPQSPSSSSFVKIATHITTSNLSNFISKSFTVNSQQNIIELESCYYMTMMTAIGEYVDTFAVGNLNPGNYTIQFKVNMSSSPGSCVPGSSNTATGSFSVNGTTFIPEAQNQETSFRAFPNPVRDILIVEHSGAMSDLTCSIRNSLGQLVFEQMLVKPKDGIDMESFPGGVYFMELNSATGTKRIKVIKE